MCSSCFTIVKTLTISSFSSLKDSNFVCASAAQVLVRLLLGVGFGVQLLLGCWKRKMPIEKNADDYYKSYCASQRRVEQWVSETEKQILQEQGQGSSPASQQPEWKGFLDDPGLVTPVSMAPMTLAKGKSRETQAETDVGSMAVSDPTHRLSQLTHRSAAGSSAPKASIIETSDTQGRRMVVPTMTATTAPTTTTIPPSSSKRTLDQHRLPQSQETTPTRSRTLDNKKSKIDLGMSSFKFEPPDDTLNDLPRSASKQSHSKELKHSQSRRTLDSKGKPISTSSSRKHRSVSRSHKPSRSTRSPAFDLDFSDLTPMLAYVPYGVIPLLFAVTTGSIGLSLAAAALMLVGYFSLDSGSSRERERDKRSKVGQLQANLVTFLLTSFLCVYSRQTEIEREVQKLQEDDDVLIFNSSSIPTPIGHNRHY